MSLGCAPSSESVKIKTVSAQENPSKITKTTWIFKKPSAAHEKLYRRVLPKAASFTEREIPKRLLTKQDSDSNYYAAAKNKTGQIFAWLRPIHAKVRKSDEEQRLQVVLVYDSKLKYQTFVLLDSVKKDDGSLFTQEEKLRLREIAKNPDPELAKMRLLRMVADSRTLKPVAQIKDSVIPGAPFLTSRLVQQVLNTTQLLKLLPGIYDGLRIEKALTNKKGPEANYKALCKIWPSMEDSEMKGRTLKRMVREYSAALELGSTPNPEMEKMILLPANQENLDTTLVADSCYLLAKKGLRSDFVKECTDFVSTSEHGTEQTSLWRLVGTLAFMQKDYSRAYGELRQAAEVDGPELDPHLHWRFAQTLLQTGQKEAACKVATALYFAAPSLPKVEVALASCVGEGEKIGNIQAQLDEQRQKLLIASYRSSGPKAPAVSVDGPNYQSFDLELAASGKITVVLFFSTWCSHCRLEIPLINQFMPKAKKRWGDSFRVIAIRTAIEREKESWAQFKAEFKPAFKIYDDPTMSFAFKRFAKVHEMQTTLPTLAVIDKSGVARFFIKSGDYRKTDEELLWAIEAITNGVAKR